MKKKKEKRSRVKIKIGIIAGEGASAFLDSLLEAEEMKVVGVVDKDKDSLLMRDAARAKIFHTTDFPSFFRHLHKNLIIDFSLDREYEKNASPQLLKEAKIISGEMVDLLTSLVRDRKRLLRTQVAMRRVSEIIVSTFDLRKILNLVLYLASRLMRVDICSVRLLDEKKERLILSAATGLSRQYLEKGDIPAGEGVAGWVLKNEKPYVCRNIKSESLYKYGQRALKEGLVSLLCIPLLVKGQSIGVLSIYTTSPRSFTLEEEKLFMSFGNQVGIIVENAKLFRDIQDSYLGLLEALGATIEARDFYTAEHSWQVRDYALKIAQSLGISKEEKEAIAYASLLHDIGKIGVNDRILSKPAKLTPEEFKVVTTHSRIGANIVSHVKILKHLSPLILHLHERYDGRGYPQGLRNGEIPIGARILMAADAYAAMTSDRPYRKALSEEEAIKELKENRGTQFDPQVVDVFLSILEEK